MNKILLVLVAVLLMPSPAPAACWTDRYGCIDPAEADRIYEESKRKEAEEKQRQLDAYRRANQPKEIVADHSFFRRLTENIPGDIGRTFTFTGQIVQSVAGAGGAYALRVNVTQGPYNWSDTIWVDFPASASKQASLNEGATVEFLSRFMGQKSYIATLGQTIQLPHMTACEARQAKRGMITAPRSC